MVRIWGWRDAAVLEVFITKRSSTKWEWRVYDRYGATIIGGFESSRPAAKYRVIGRCFICCLRAGFGDRASRNIRQNTNAEQSMHFRGSPMEIAKSSGFR
jgi:hypothetical protein